MVVTNLSIRLRTSVLVLTGLVVAGGLYAYVALPKESNPSIEIPNIVVTTIYPGASPTDVESLITQPIEREIQGISGIEKINSTSTEGVSTVVVEFTPDVEMSEANQKVREKVDLAKSDLPAEAEEPIISEIDFSEFPIMTINLAAQYPLSRLKSVAETLEDALEGIPSVLEVNLIGGRDQEVQINVDLARLQGYGITFQDVVDAIRRENANIPGGKVDVERLNYLVRVDGQFDSPDEILELVIKSPGGRPIYVRDVAEVRMGFKDRASYSRLRILRQEVEPRVWKAVDPAEHEGYGNVISLNVKKRSGENILETSAAVQEVLEHFALPPGTEVLITGDQSEMVESLVKDLENNIISGLIFVVAVLLFFLGLRTSLLVGVAIPLSMFVSFLVFLAMGQTLNFIILFSLIIALGMLVDNAIVIVENIYRYLEEGHEHFEAARLGTGEVGGAVVASTATTLAAFIPMLFWPGIMGEFMGYLPLTLIITLSCSLFVALIINPVLTGYFARVEGREHAPAQVRLWLKVIGAIAGLMAMVVLWLVNPNFVIVLGGGGLAMVVAHLLVMRHIAGFFIHKGLPAIVRLYRRFLEMTLDRDYTRRAAYFRNMWALVSFTVGFILAALGGVIYATAGLTPAIVVLGPGAVLLGLGLVGVVLHTIEVVLCGRWASVEFGLIFGVFVAGFLGLMHTFATPLELKTFGGLMMLPASVFVIGLIGAVIGPRSGRLILTDNRAKVLHATFGGLFAIIGMFVIAPTGEAFFPDTDPSQVRINIAGQLGTNIEASNRMAEVAQRRIDALLVSNPVSGGNVENILVNVGVGGDMNFGGGARSPERSRLVLNMIDFEDRGESSRDTLAKLREQLAGIPGAEVEFTKNQQGPPTGPPVNIEITGPRFDQIVGLSKRVKAQLADAVAKGRIDGLTDIRDNMNTGRPEMQVHIDRERAAQFGLDTSKIASTIRTAINGTEASTWRDGEDEYDITVRLQASDRQSLETIKRLEIVHEGKVIPLVAIAELELGSGLGSITRLDLQRVVTVQANAKEGFNAQAVLAQVQKDLAGIELGLPAGYGMRYTGENKEKDESFSFLGSALMTGVALILMIMIAQFNRVLSPFIIMIAVALSLIGVMLGLLVTRTPFSLFTFIGVISLAGIVVNNNIVLIDYTMQLQARGRSKRDAIVEAGATRLRPVLLTAMTTVLGLIPLTFGINIDFVGLLVDLAPDFRIGSENTQFWGPMGIAIISGLTFATFLTLVIVPVMYSIFDSTAEALFRAVGRTPAAPDAAVPDASTS